MNENLIRGYEDLANAIVAQAVKDYCRLLKKLTSEKNEDNDGIYRKMEAIRKWLHSEYYHLLTKADGDYLIERAETFFWSGIFN